MIFCKGHTESNMQYNRNDRAKELTECLLQVGREEEERAMSRLAGFSIQGKDTTTEYPNGEITVNRKLQ